VLNNERQASFTISPVLHLYEVLPRSKLHTAQELGDLQVGNWHVNCQHSTLSQEKTTLL